MEMTLEQKKAVALANGRRRAAETQNGAPSTPPGPWDEAVARLNEPEAPFTLAGAGAQLGTALANGAIGVLGLPGDLASYQEGFNRSLGIDVTPENLTQMEELGLIPKGASKGLTVKLPTSGEVIGAVNNAIRPAPTTTQLVTGEQPQSFLMRQPENTEEKWVDTVGRFVGGSWVGPGTWRMKGLSGATGGVASEAAGQAFEGSPNEDLARLIGGAAGVMSPHLVAGARGSNVPRQMTARAMEGLDEATLNRADFLRQVAAQQGVDLTWPEAIQQASNGATRLNDLQRVVEFSEAGGPVMRQFYANRPAQIDAAARQQFDQIAPQPMIPERLGPRVQRAADADISDVNQAINVQARPMYQAAEAQTIPANSPALRDPSFRQAVQEIRNNPVLAPRFAHLPDNSIGVIDAAQKIMRSRAEALQVPGPGLNPYQASLTRQARRDVSNQARNQSPEYDAAVQYQRQLREEYLNPLEQGPTGRLAGTPDVRAQTQALFPAQPAAQSEVGVARAMRGIGRTDPEAAAGVVRQHLETVFNEATQRLQSGPNQFGGAKFSAVVAGNPQQRRSLFAAIRALPNGDLLWRGFNRFLNVLEATGKRPAPNSMTEFNAMYRKELERGGYGGELATIAGSPQKALTFIKDGYARFRLGRNTAQLARLFTQGNVEEFRTLLNNGPLTPRALVVMVRLLAQVQAGTSGLEPVQ